MVAALVLTSVLGPYLGLGVCVRLAVLVAAWTGVWVAGAWALRRFGPGSSGGVTLGIACVCMAAPVVAMPLVHAAAHWGPAGTVSPWQGRVVEVIGHVCPFFAVLDALRPVIRVDWGTLPGMYAWSGLGQEIPLALPGVWTCTAIYAGGAILVLLGGRMARGKTTSSV